MHSLRGFTRFAIYEQTWNGPPSTLPLQYSFGSKGMAAGMNLFFIFVACCQIACCVIFGDGTGADLLGGGREGMAYSASVGCLLFFTILYIIS